MKSSRMSAGRAPCSAAERPLGSVVTAGLTGCSPSLTFMLRGSRKPTPKPPPRLPRGPRPGPRFPLPHVEQEILDAAVPGVLAQRALAGAAAHRGAGGFVGEQPLGLCDGVLGRGER